MRFGDDQDMYRCDRVDVVKCQKIVVFKNFVGGNLSGDDFAEYTHGLAPSFRFAPL
jgi:hypothetical protein